MIYKRAVARLRAQDWVAITIEVAIVIIGVFIGTQVANWNEARLEQRETQQKCCLVSNRSFTISSRCTPAPAIITD